MRSHPVKYYIIKIQRNSLFNTIFLLLEVLALTRRCRTTDAQQEILSLANQSVDQGSIMGSIIIHGDTALLEKVFFFSKGDEGVLANWLFELMETYSISR